MYLFAKYTFPVNDSKYNLDGGGCGNRSYTVDLDLLLADHLGFKLDSFSFYLCKECQKLFVKPSHFNLTQQEEEIETAVGKHFATVGVCDACHYHIGIK